MIQEFCNKRAKLQDSSKIHIPFIFLLGLNRGQYETDHDKKRLIYWIKSRKRRFIHDAWLHGAYL